jgi:hypothetical protein
MMLGEKIRTIFAQYVRYVTLSSIFAHAEHIAFLVQAHALTLNFQSLINLDEQGIDCKHAMSETNTCRVSV